MTSQGNGQPVRYEVKVSELLKSIIRRLHHRAIQRGEGQQFLDSLRTIHARLQNDPEQFGERLYHLPALELVIYHGAVTPIVVTYGVHQERPLVFLSSVKMLG